jgi:hypothetical protein
MKFLLAILIILLTASCNKTIDSPSAPPEPPKAYHLVIRCTDFKRDTLRLRNGMIIPRWLCTKSVIDTVKN